jgi:flagellar basal-body rod modification protein FlgD
MISDIGAAGTSTLTQVANPGGKMGKEEFLKMLVAQLKNQDPMSPMKGDEMAAQLAQFSSLEQLTNISKAMEDQAASQQGLIATINDTTALSFLGKTVLAVGGGVEVGADGSGEVRFDVGGQGGLATLKILDDNGRVIGSRALGFVAAGPRMEEVGAAASGLAAGSYRYAIEVVDSAGKRVPTETYVSARIDGVSYGMNGPVLTSGTMAIPFGKVLRITAD